jgi:ubiquinone/menaquinone biosynthesis C-methylase UbiE
MDLNSYFIDFYKRADRLAPGSISATRNAFSLLPLADTDIDILDIGCGNGAQTIELASIPGVDIYAVDIHDEFLINLKNKINQSEFLRKIKLIKADMNDLPFRHQQFDLIWSEGSIYIMGFRNGLNKLKKFLKTNGYFVVSEISWLKNDIPDEINNYWNSEYPEISDIKTKKEVIKECGYELISDFTLEESCWMDYYNSLNNVIDDYLSEHNNNAFALEVINEFRNEFNLYKKYKDCYSYVFYVLKLI